MGRLDIPGDREKLRKIQGYRDLWMLEAKLKDEVTGEKNSKVA